MKTATYHWNNQILTIHDDDAWKLQRTTGLLGTSGYQETFDFSSLTLTFHVQHPINRIHADEWIDCVLSINC
jgi:hypothetical protein